MHITTQDEVREGRLLKIGMFRKVGHRLIDILPRVLLGVVSSLLASSLLFAFA